jgi:hypothetical protein
MSSTQITDYIQIDESEHEQVPIKVESSNAPLKKRRKKGVQKNVVEFGVILQNLTQNHHMYR